VILTLQIIAPSGPGQDTHQVFTQAGGTIGRASGNSWVLAHNEVSARHARISFQNGVFYIQDTSRNGVSVNSPENRLVRDRPYAHKHGDRIFIDPYEIDVSIASSGQAVRPSLVDPFGPDDLFASPGAPAGSPLLDSPAEVISGGEVDPLQLLGGSSKPAPVRQPDDPLAIGDDLLGQHYQPPVARDGPRPSGSNSGAIPQGYNPLASDDSLAGSIPAHGLPSAEPVRPRPSPRNPVPPKTRDVPPPAPVRAVPEPGNAPAVAAPQSVPAGEEFPSQELREVLIGAGLHGAAVTPQLARCIGQILRVVVSGMMDVLQARQRIKEEFDMRQTIFRPADNNPLKFSANVDDALHNLLVKRNAAYLGPVDAFADAFEDLRNHQLAMLAGMRVAFEAMLAESDPDRLQEEFDRQLAKVSLPLMPAKLRYWDLYRERRREIVKDPEAAFAELFGEEFARAYEEQFRTLKAQRRGRSGDRPADIPPPE
jgi:type VI secretion system FHA domain protein